MLNSRKCAVYAGSGLLAVAAMTFAGCQDKAKASYDQCLQLDLKGDIPGAWDACTAATVADPASNDGKAAGAKLADMKPGYEFWQREQAKKAADEILLVAKGARANDGRRLDAFLEEAARSAVEDTNLALGISAAKLVNSWSAAPFGNDIWQVTYVSHIGSDFDGRAVQSEYVFEFNAAARTMSPLNQPAREALGTPQKRASRPQKRK